MVKKVNNDCPIAPVAGHFWRGDGNGNVLPAIPNVPCEHWDNEKKECLDFKPSHRIHELIREVLEEQGRS